LKGIFQSINTELKDETRYHKEIVVTDLVNLLFRIKRNLFHTDFDIAKPSRQQDLFNNYKKLIKEHFQTKKQVKDYAELLFITSKHLNDTIKSLTNRPALYFIHERVIHEAEYLLVYSTLSIKEIASTLSFENSTHFSRFFKKKRTVTPLQFRTDNK